MDSLKRPSGAPRISNLSATKNTQFEDYSHDDIIT